MTLLDQAQSTQRLQDNIRQVLASKFPYIDPDSGYTFDVSDVRFKPEDISHEAQLHAYDNNENIETPVQVTVTVRDPSGQEVFKPFRDTIARLPQVTDRGTYIRGGNETIILNRMSLRPGIYVHHVREKAKTDIINGEVRAGRFRFLIVLDLNKPSLTAENLSMEYGQSGKVNAFALLKILGATDQEIRDAIGDDDLFQKLRVSKIGANTTEKIFKVTHTSDFPGAGQASERIKNFFNNQLTFGESGQSVNKITMGTAYSTFDKQAFLSVITNMVREKNGPGANPNVDDMRFKEVDSGEDLLAESFANGLDQWINRVLKPFGKDPKGKDKVKSQQFVQKNIEEMMRGNLAELADVANPLALHQAKQKVTVLGPGGLSPRSATNENRNLQDTAFAKLDPVETPQSENLGLIQHLSKDAHIRNGRIHSTFYKVTNGVVDKSNAITDVDPLDEFDEYIAFNDPRQIDKVGNVLHLKGPKVRARHKGNFIEVDPSQVTLIDKSPSSVLGYATSLVPFGSHNDGARMLMAASMATQAMALENAEAPLVQSVAEDDGLTVEQEVADKASFLLKAPVSGTIKNIGDDHITITGADGADTEVPKLNYFTTGKMGGYINHKPVVNVGDSVQAGDLLADGWQSKNGQLALGKNTLVAYMPFEGYNFEDGVVASDSWADSMASEEINPLEFTMKPEIIAGTRDVKDILKSLGVDPGLLQKLDADGVIQKGVDIGHDDIFVGAIKKRTPEEFSMAERALNAMKGKGDFITLPENLYRDVSERVTGYQKGRVIDVRKIRQPDGEFKVIVKLLSFKPMEVGDKLSGRHGNKGIITAIMPDNEMPRTEDGQSVQLIFSPLAVPSRKNVGQLLEVNAGLVAQKKGMSVYKVKNFDPAERDRLMKELKDIGYEDGKMTLINPTSGKPYENKVTVGPKYIMKLKHKVESKLTARNYLGADGNDVDRVTLMPKKVSGSIDGERRNPQGVGGMEFWSLTSAGAVNNIHEMTTLKSDGAGDAKARQDIFYAIRNGTKIADPVTPQTLKVLKDNLTGLGIEMAPVNGDRPATLDEQFTGLMLQPMKRSSFARLNATPITKIKAVDVTHKEVVRGGLYDEEIFGKDKDQWARIDLGEPMPNPLFLQATGPRPYEAMLFSKGITNRKLEQIIKKGDFIIMDPKDSGHKQYDVVERKEVERLQDEGIDVKALTGSTALRELLKDVDLKAAYADAEARIKNPKLDLDARSTAEKHVRVLANALDKGLEPEDYLMHFVPVLPLKYRPLIRNNKNEYTEEGLTLLYQQMIGRQEALKKKHKEHEKTLESMKEAGVPVTWGPEDLLTLKEKQDDHLATYQALEHIVGVGKPFVNKSTGKQYLGIMHKLESKEGFLREDMQKKMQDYSGRSVITVDPNLQLDEVGLPEDMAAVIFEPHIQRELRAMRIVSADEIKKAFEERNAQFRTALERAIRHQPVILNRQPSLHRHSMQAFKPQIRWNEDKRPNRTIGLNPLVVTGFNADFDGDTMPVFVPITEAAKKEAEEKLMPSKNLLNPTNNSLIMELKHEMQLGIFYMTRDRMPEGSTKNFRDLDELRRAYEKGEVGTYDSVSINGKVSTAGRHLFNLSLPRKYQDYDKNVAVGKEKLNELMMEIINDPSPGMGPAAAVTTMNLLKNLSFKVSTISGISIGVKDFDPVAEGKERLVAGMRDAQLVIEDAKTAWAKEQVEKMIRKDQVLSEDNPVEIMRRSGARGDAKQINAMAGIIGIGTSVTNRPTRPILASHLEGLSPNQFWDLSYDSRKGIFDKSIATSRPGFLTRQLWMANKQTIISEHDCGDTQGIVLPMKSDAERRALRGRVLLEQVEMKRGNPIPVTGAPISLADYERAQVEGAVVGVVRVRSPLTCKSTLGVCQLCYGSRAGGTDNKLVPIGEAIGSIAAQALGEPSQQAIMRTFHVGAGNANQSGAFERIQNVLTSPEKMNKAVLAVMVEDAGTITKIDRDQDGKVQTVWVGKRKYQLNGKPLADALYEGVAVQPGDVLTKEKGFEDGELRFYTYRDPHEVLRIQGVDAARNYLVGSLTDALEAGGAGDTDRRHLEVAVTNMTNKAKVVEPGNSPFLPGRGTTLQNIRKFNDLADNGRPIDVDMSYTNRPNIVGSKAAIQYTDRKNRSVVIVAPGQEITDAIWDRLYNDGYSRIRVIAKPITSFEPAIVGAGKSNDPKNNPNWLDNAAFQAAASAIGGGAALGSIDRLTTPLTRQMTGLKGNFSEGFQEWRDKYQDKLSAFIHNFF